MRTTVNLDEDILRMADQLAESHGISRGEAISQLAWRGVQQVQKPLPTKVRNGFAVLDLKGGKKFSSDDVVLALHREETSRARRHS
jgi:metal-responsive CopG/Arc/MetJ family transcriptional regulator